MNKQIERLKEIFDSEEAAIFYDFADFGIMFAGAITGFYQVLTASSGSWTWWWFIAIIICVYAGTDALRTLIEEGTGISEDCEDGDESFGEGIVEDY